MTFDEAAFLPYLASFERFVPRYIAWLHARDHNGAHWLAGESKLTASPPQWAGVEMEGVIDRIDSVPGPTPAPELIDYKTGARRSCASRSGGRTRTRSSRSTRR